jgi:CheY-like chemotaxis protein
MGRGVACGMGEPADIRSSDPIASRLTVLVVEDEILIRLAIADFLRDCGFRVLETNTADEAVQVLRTSEPVHVVFTDVQMPGTLDGFGLARWIRTERPDVEVILTSGVARAVGAAGELCRDGALMSKPYDPQEVERRIRQLLATQPRS